MLHNNQAYFVSWPNQPSLNAKKSVWHNVNICSKTGLYILTLVPTHAPDVLTLPSRQDTKALICELCQILREITTWTKQTTKHKTINYRHKITWLKPPKRYSIAIIAQPKSPQAQIYKPTSHQANHPTHPPDVRHGSFHAPGCHQPTLGPNMKKCTTIYGTPIGDQ